MASPPPAVTCHRSTGPDRLHHPARMTLPPPLRRPPPGYGSHMSALAAEGGATALGAWAYLVILAAAAASYLGVPLVGTAIIGLAGTLASDGRLNLAGVLVAALIGCELGGLAGYEIGTRWGRRL